MRQHLEKKNLKPETCRYRFIAYGPVLTEAATKDQAGHYPLRDKIAPMEKELATLLTAAGYAVLNEVRSRKPLDEDAFRPVLEAFAEYFPRLLSR